MLKKLPLNAYVYSALTLNLVVALVIFLIRGNLPPVVPLFYGKPVGSEQLIPTFYLLIAPAAAVVITIINVFLTLKIKDDFSKKIFSVASFFVSVLIAITVIRIILLVGYW